MADGKGHFYGGDLDTGHMDAPAVGGMNGGSAAPMNSQGGNQGPVGKHPKPWTDEKGYIHPADPAPKKVAPPVNSAPDVPSSTPDNTPAQDIPEAKSSAPAAEIIPWYKKPENHVPIERQNSLDSAANANAEKVIKMNPLSPMAPQPQ